MVVEDGTGLSNADSFVSVAYADAYFLARNVTEWASLTNKEALLIQACDYLEAVYSQSWKGVLYNDAQSLSFPRLVDDVFEFPERVKKAQCELALKANEGALMTDVEQRTTRETVGAITVEYAEYANQLKQYTFVYNLVSPYLLSGNTSKRLIRC